MSSFSRLFRLKRTRIEVKLTDVQIDQLRAVMDNLPLDPYASLVVAVVKQLPLSDAVPSNSGVGADLRTLTPSGSAGGFSLIPITPKGKAGLREIERVLGTLEVVDDNTCVHALKSCEQCCHGLGPEWQLPHGGGGSL